MKDRNMESQRSKTKKEQDLIVWIRSAFCILHLKRDDTDSRALLQKKETNAQEGNILPVI